METRNILDWQGNIVGVMSLPNWTSEAVWQAKLAPYAKPPETLAEAIARRIAEMELLTKQFIESKVSQESQMAFSMLMMMAHIDSQTNRFNYLKQLWTWTQTVLLYNINSIVAVSQMATVAEVNAFQFDLDANIAAFPNVDMFTAIQITD